MDGPTVVPWVGARIVPLSRTVDLRSTFRLRISARSAIDRRSNSNVIQRSPVVRGPPRSFAVSPLPMPCRVYDFGLFRFRDRPIADSAELSPRVANPEKQYTRKNRVVGSLIAHHFSRSEVAGSVMKMHAERSGVSRACPRGFWLMSRVHPRSGGYGCEQLVEGTSRDAVESSRAPKPCIVALSLCVSENRTLLPIYRKTRSNGEKENGGRLARRCAWLDGSSSKG